jgi:hypothetical protein
MDRFFFERIARGIYAFWWVCVIIVLALKAFGA